MTAKPNKSIIADLIEGMHPHKVAEIHKCTRANAFQTKRKLIEQGLIDEPKPVKSNERKSKHYVKIIEMHLNGSKPCTIADVLQIKPSTVYNQISEYNKSLKKQQATANEYDRCKEHDILFCWYCYSKEVAGREPLEPCLDYIFSNTI